MTSPLGPWVTEEEGCALVRPMSAAAKSPMRFLSDLALRYPGRIIRGLILSILGTLLAFVLPNATRWIIDEIIPARDLNQLRQAIAWTLGALLFRQVFFTLRTLSNNEFQLRMTSDLRSLLHAKMQHLPVSWFDRQSTGDTITRMSDDVPATQRAIIDTVDQSIPALMQIVTTLAVMGGLHGGLTAVALAPMPFIALDWPVCFLTTSPGFGRSRLTPWKMPSRRRSNPGASATGRCRLGSSGRGPFTRLPWGSSAIVVGS